MLDNLDGEGDFPTWVFFSMFLIQIIPTHAFFVFRNKNMSGMAERSTCPGGLDRFHDLLDCRFSGGHFCLH